MKIKTTTHVLAMATGAALAALSSVAQAALVINWTERQGLAPVSDMDTASPTVGDIGTANSADARSIWATMPTVTLANNGDMITLSGSVTLSGIDTSHNQFRFGLFNVNGSTGDTGWLGYTGSHGHNTTGANLSERTNANTTWYMSGPTTIATSAIPNTAFTDATYNFLLSLERVVGGLQINSSIIRTSDSTQFGLLNFLDPTVSTYTFDRVAFLIGNTLDADQAQFSNIDVTLIPEPSTALLGGLGLLALLRRRR